LKLIFITPKRHVLSVKIGPTDSSVGARKKRKKRSKHSKVLGVYFTYVGGKNPWADWPNFSW